MSLLKPPQTEEIFEKLPFPERLVLWSIRLWVDALENGHGISERIHDAYKLSRAGDAYLDLDALMTIIATSSMSTIDIRREKCAAISSDEKIFLCAVAMSQPDLTQINANAILERWVPAEELDNVSILLSQLALKLNRAGLHLNSKKYVNLPTSCRLHPSTPNPVNF